MVTNEFERDVNDTSFLKRPGRIDLRILQNTPDCGDGHPGLQRCFRNYLHEGGMEKDLQLLGHGILGTSVNINNAELQQLSNIGSATITGDQWGYVGGADQPVKIADSPTFVGLTLSANVVTTSTIDDVNISDFKSNYDTHKGSTGADHGYLDQSVVQASSPTFVGLTLSANVVTTSTFDNVDVSDLKDAFDNHKGNDGSDHSFIDQSVVQSASPTFVGLTLTANIVTSSTVDGVDVGSHVHSGAGQGGTVDHASLDNIGTNAHSVIDTHLGDKIKHDNIAPFHQFYSGGFTLGGDWGAHWEIACSDSDADVYLCFMVQDPGTYRLKHASYCTVEQASSPAGGNVYIGRIGYGDDMTWNVADNQSWTLSQEQYQPRWNDQEYLTDIVTTTVDNLVYVRWHKDDNMNSRPGNWRVLGWWLERTV